MRPHFHAGIEHVVLYGVSAVIFINVAGLLAAQLAKQNGSVGKFGAALGAVIPWKG